MERRDFFKSILWTPLLTPFFLASKRAASDSELYMITDFPEISLPPLLHELKTQGFVVGNTYSISGAFTPAENFARALSASGWRPVTDGSPAHMTISSSFLGHSAQPSFTLARRGRIWDLRTRNLRSLWSEMHGQAPATQLISVSFNTRPGRLIAGKKVSLFSGGEKISTLELTSNSKNYVTLKEGRILVSIKDGRASIEESSCRHKICVHCPPAVFAQERIICAPHRFMLEIDGSSTVDTIIG